MRHFSVIAATIARRLLVRSRPAADDGSGTAASRSWPRVTFHGVIALGWLVSMVVFPAVGAADTLAGTVVGKDGQPRAYVRIDVIGPQKVVVVADENGRFAVDVPPGRYKVRVTDDRRRMDFPASSPTQDKQFKLSW